LIYCPVPAFVVSRLDAAMCAVYQPSGSGVKSPPVPCGKSSVLKTSSKKAISHSPKVIAKDGRPGVVVIASNSGAVILSSAAFQTFTFISGFQRNKLER